MSSIFGDFSGWLTGLLYSLPGILLGLVLHEFAHAFAADRLGDPTPRMMGRLTLNPLPHLDPVGAAMIVFAGFGWAKPVMTNPARYKIKRYGFAIVGIAGPLMNFIIAVVSMLIGLLLANYTHLGGNEVLMNVIFYTAYINIALMVFNLIPIPPLDGYNILKDLLLIRVVKPQTLWNIEKYGQLLLIGLVLVSSQFSIISKVSTGVYSGIGNLLSGFFG